MKAPALDPFEERLAVDRLGEALVLRPRVEGPLVITRADLARLRDVLGPDPENDPASAEALRRRDQRPTSAVAAKADARGPRRPTRAPIETSRRRRADTGTEKSMRATPLSSRTAPRLSEAALKKLTLVVGRKVLAQPAIQGVVIGLSAWGGSPEAFAATVVRKLSAPTKTVLSKAPTKPSAARRVRDLEARLAKELNPIEAAELRRKTAFARLEADTEKKSAARPFAKPALSTASVADRIAALRRKGGAR